MIIHPFKPVFSEKSKILILGSFPSVRSRETLFYYGNERNRFWQVLAHVFGEPAPSTTDEKVDFILSHSLALWDVVYSCDITGSADNAIRNVTANDVLSLVKKTKINSIFTNGKTAGRLYEKYLEKIVGIKAVTLPSTSPANAAASLEKLVDFWKILKE